MTKGEREELKRLAREKARVAKADASRRSADLLASLEHQIATEYQWDQEVVWTQVTQEVAEAVGLANERIAERCVELGIPAEFAPSLSFSWNARSPRWEVQSSQQLLRRAAKARIDALERTARHEIDRATLDIQTQLVREGLSSEDAIAFLERMPSLAELMPAFSLAELGTGEAASSDDVLL